MCTYINPFTDFGFKLIFGQEESKPFLIDFLNDLLADDPGFSPIVDIDYRDKERTKRRKEERGVIYDIYCTTSDGRHFVVEMQNSAQNYFIDRGIYYVARSIAEQGEVGSEWDFRLMPVYFVAFMNFTMVDLKDKITTQLALCDLDSQKQVSDKMRFIFIQLPLFKKEKKEECRTSFEQWLYILKNMQTMTTMPFTQDKKLFEKLAKVASYANLSLEERHAYDADLQAYRDIRNQMEYAKQSGHAIGRAEGRAEGIIEGKAQGLIEEMRSMAKKLKENGVDSQTIANSSGLSLAEIESL